MKKVLFRKIQTYLLIGISIVLIIVSVQLYQEKRENDRQYKMFLNQFYFKLTSAMESLDTVLEESLDRKDLNQALERVDQSLEKVDLMLNTGSRFVDRDIYYIPYSSVFSNHPISQFADDNRLTNEEEQYLESLRKDLTAIHAGLHSEETGQEDRNLSVSEFNYFIKGSELKSGFLTEHKSIDVPFQVVDVEQVPDRIGKWLEKNIFKEQRKVFFVNGKTYVLLVFGREKDDIQQMTITNMVQKGSGIIVNYENTEKLADSERDSSVVIAELERGTTRPFQFNTQGAADGKVEKTIKNDNMHVSVSGEFSVELTFVEKLSKEGEIVE